MYIHRLVIGGSLSFSNKQEIHVFECCYFLNGIFYELANHYVFKYQAQKLCYSFMCTFSVFCGQKCCGHTCLYLRFVQVFCSRFFLQGSDTNLKFNT